MPNWCRNVLKIKEKNELVKIVNAEEEVDYNILLPMPEDLNVTSGGMNDRDMYIYLSKGCTVDISETPAMAALRGSSVLAALINSKRIDSFKESYMKMNEEEKEKSCQDGQKLVENFMRYGAITWYDWCCANWGVKWNASDTSIAQNGDVTEIFFYSPWSPPRKWLQKLSAEGVKFTLDWDEEGGYYGTKVSDGHGAVQDTDLGNCYDDMEDEEGGEADA